MRCYSPLGFQAVNVVKSKWTAAGYELRFDGGSAMIAYFEGRIVALAWQSMGDVARYQFAKDCDELLHRNVKELGHIDSCVYAVSGNFREAEYHEKVSTILWLK